MVTENILRCVFERKFILRCSNCNNKDYTNTFYKTKSKGEILGCCLDKTMREINVKHITKE